MLYVSFQTFKPDLKFVILRKNYLLFEATITKCHCMSWQVDIQSSLPNRNSECVTSVFGGTLPGTGMIERPAEVLRFLLTLGPDAEPRASSRAGETLKV